MWWRRLRLWSGLIVALFVCMHFANHAFGIVSLAAMNDARPYLTALWWHPALLVALYGSLGIHVALALQAIFKRRSLRMPLAEALQIGLGLAVPALLVGHVIGTRGANALTGVDTDYPLVMLSLWSNEWLRVKQALLVLVVWFHLLVGLHLWLRAAPALAGWYARRLPVLTALAVLLPVLALLGYLRAGFEVLRLAEDPAELAIIRADVDAVDPGRQAVVLDLLDRAPFVIGGLLVAVFAARVAWIRWTSRGGRVRITHPVRSIVLEGGQTVLEALRNAGVPHASVCGGRARCTTCRIRVGDGAAALAPPGNLESVALARVGAAPNVRLACQARPTHDLSITPLLPPGQHALERARRGGVAGREQTVVAMFVDLRDSTGLGEARLPYDVVFILNEFFAEMSVALEETRGHYAQFSGDGLMALYGLEVPLREGCRDALRGAVRMGMRLEALNRRLGSELPAPLRIGIGIHAGEAIVGTMGPPSSPNFSAVGDTINIAARLEAQCKPLGCALVVSVDTAAAAGIDLSAFAMHEAAVRGRQGAVNVFAVPSPADVSPLLS